MKDYTKDEIAFIEENYDKLSYRDIATILNRTEGTVAMKINRMGLIKKEKWSDDEIDVMLENYSIYNNQIIQDLLPNRKIEDICNMAVKLGLRKNVHNEKQFSKEQLILMLENVSRTIGRTPLTIELKEFGLPHSKTWERYFGGYRQACILAGISVNGDFHGKSVSGVSLNGDYCASKAELKITNFFIQNSIPYEKEVLYKKLIDDTRCKNKKVDWIIFENIFVEYFGMPEKESYFERMKEKRILCREHGFILVELFRRDLNKLEKVFNITN